MMIETYLQKYIEYNNNSVQFNRIVLIKNNEKYYLFYNEATTINPNNLLIQFPYDGCVEYETSRIYFYVAFDEHHKNNILEKMKTYDIVIIDENKIAIEILKKEYSTSKINFFIQRQVMRKSLFTNTPPYFMTEYYASVNMIKELEKLKEKQKNEEIIEEITEEITEEIKKGSIVEENKKKESTKYNKNNKSLNKIISIGCSIDDIEKTPDEEYLLMDDLEHNFTTASKQSQTNNTDNNMANVANVANIKKTDSDVLLEQYIILGE